MLKFCQMTGPGLANAAGQAVAMHCVRGRSGVTKPAPPGPLCCILWAFSGVAPRRTDGKFTVKLLSGGGRHRSRVTFALTGGCIAVQPVSCQSTTQITALQHAPQATTNPAVFVRAAASSHPSFFRRTPPCAEAMTHTSQTPKAGHALNQIFCYGGRRTDRELGGGLRLSHCICQSSSHYCVRMFWDTSEVSKVDPRSLS